jgi:hypothetical protein
VSDDKWPEDGKGLPSVDELVQEVYEAMDKLGGKVYQLQLYLSTVYKKDLS